MLGNLRLRPRGPAKPERRPAAAGDDLLRLVAPSRHSDPPSPCLKTDFQADQFDGNGSGSKSCPFVSQRFVVTLPASTPIGCAGTSCGELHSPTIVRADPSLDSLLRLPSSVPLSWHRGFLGYGAAPAGTPDLPGCPAKMAGIDRRAPIMPALRPAVARQSAPWSVSTSASKMLACCRSRGRAVKLDTLWKIRALELAAFNPPIAPPRVRHPARRPRTEA